MKTNLTLFPGPPLPLSPQQLEFCRRLALSVTVIKLYYFSGLELEHFNDLMHIFII